jgi:GH18 family chitinase
VYTINGDSVEEIRIIMKVFFLISMIIFLGCVPTINPSRGTTNTQTPTVIGVPSAPIIGAAVAGNSSAVVNFSLPLSSGGTSNLSYTATSSPGNFTSTGNASPLTIVGLTNGLSYSFTVKATNSFATSVASATSNSVIPFVPVSQATIPDPPIMGNAIAGNTQATINFSPPLSDGGMPINRFTVTSSAGHVAISTTSPITISNLINGTSYTFIVSATNSIGTSQVSATSNSITPAAPAGGPTTGPLSGLWATAYYPAYGSQTMAIAAIPFNSMTHVIHFALVPAHSVGTGTLASTAGPLGTLTDPDGLLLQTSAFVSAAHAAGVKAILGIGGNTATNAPLAFQQATQTIADRTTLVNNIVTTMFNGGYDGVDINWESIVFPGDVFSFQSFISELRTALDLKSPPIHYLLTYPAGTSGDFNNYSNYANMILPIQNSFDQINLQTYGMAGAYPGWVTWHNSPLYAGACLFTSTGQPPPSIDSTIQAFSTAGIIKKKMGIGIQLAIIDWAGGSGTITGGVTAPCQFWDYTNNNQGAPLTTLTPASNIATFSGYVAQFDTVTKVPWLSSTQILSANDHFVSYEDMHSILEKGNYLKTQGLGGAIIFEVTGDYLSAQTTPDAQHPIMSAVRQYITH